MGAGLPLPPLAGSGLSLHGVDDERLLRVEGGENEMEAQGHGRLGETGEPRISHAVSPVTEQNEPIHPALQSQTPDTESRSGETLAVLL